MAVSIAAEAAAVFAKKGGKSPGKKSDHPPTSEMVNAAISTLNERKGSSLPAIKKFIVSNYSVDLGRLQSSFIRKYLRAAVEKKTIAQTTGFGASGRFKLAKLERKPTVQVKVEGKPASAKKVLKKSDRPTKQRGAKATASSRVPETRRTNVSSAPKAKKDNKVAAPVGTKSKKTVASSKSKSKE